MSMDLQKLMKAAEARKGLSDDGGATNSRPNRKLQLFILVTVLCVGLGIFFVGQYRGARPVAAADVAATPTVAPASSVFTGTLPVLVVTATPTASPTEPPPVFRETVEVEVTRIVQVEIPVEVTRIVEVVSTPVVTPTPGLSPGAVRICIDASAAKELYINGVGAAGGRCYDYVVGSGSSYFTLQVNR